MCCTATGVRSDVALILYGDDLAQLDGGGVRCARKTERRLEADRALLRGLVADQRHALQKAALVARRAQRAGPLPDHLRPVRPGMDSGRYLPLAPITHHWFDSTHITYGVLTAG